MLRRTEPKDLETIYRMLCELEGTELPYPDFREVFLRNIASDDNYYMVYEDHDGKVLGHFSMHTQWLLHHAGRVAEIQEMYLAPESRGLGYGEVLLKEGMAWAAEKKCVSVEVTANLKRERTHGFYEKNGFVHTHKKFTLQLP